MIAHEDELQNNPSEELHSAIHTTVSTAVLLYETWMIFLDRHWMVLDWLTQKLLVANYLSLQLATKAVPLLSTCRKQVLNATGRMTENMHVTSNNTDLLKRHCVSVRGMFYGNYTRTTSVTMAVFCTLHLGRKKHFPFSFKETKYYKWGHTLWASYLTSYSYSFFKLRILWFWDVIINPTFIKVFTDEKQVVYGIHILFACPNSEAVPIWLVY